MTELNDFLFYTFCFLKIIHRYFCLIIKTFPRPTWPFSGEKGVRRPAEIMHNSDREGQVRSRPCTWKSTKTLSLQPFGKLVLYLAVLGEGKGSNLINEQNEVTVTFSIPSASCFWNEEWEEAQLRRIGPAGEIKTRPDSPTWTAVLLARIDRVESSEWSSNFFFFLSPQKAAKKIKPFSSHTQGSHSGLTENTACLHGNIYITKTLILSESPG